MAGGNESFNFQILPTMANESIELLNSLTGDEVSADPNDILPNTEELEKEEKQGIKDDSKPKSEKKTKEEKPKPTLQEILDSQEKEEEESDNKEENEGREDNSKTSQDTPEEGEAEGNQYTEIANDFFNIGILSVEDGEDQPTITSGEELLTALEKQHQKRANEIISDFIGQFGDDYQAAFDAIYRKGVNPKDWFGTYENIQSFADMDLTKEENQKSVIRQSLRDQGFEEEDIDAEIQKLENYGDLESTASRFHKTLIKKEAQKLAKLAADKEVEQKRLAIQKQEYLKNTADILNDKIKTKEFDGIPVNQKLAGQVHEFLTVDKWKLPSGELITDFDKEILDLKRPENHAKKVKLALLIKLMESDPTFSTIQKVGVSKKSDELFQSLAKQKNRQGNTNNKKSEDKITSWF